MDTLSHFAKGSSKPSIPDDGQLRLYSMRFCPYAHRVHLALNAKHIPYHVVYINLSEKPEWYPEVNPNGKVPALQLVNEPNEPFLTESLVLCEYLDEKYPDVPLYPKDPLEKANAKLLIERFGQIGAPYYRLVYDTQYKNEDELLDVIYKELDFFEDVLRERNATYFGGDLPNILDYAIWPWFERFGVLAEIVGDKYKLNDENYPILNKWIHSMKNDPAVHKHALSTYVHSKFALEKRAGTPNYNMLLEDA